MHNNRQPTSGGYAVLLVEDCPDQSRLYLKILQKSGFEVTLECCGRSAVTVVRNSPQRFDAIVMDFQMPEMDGREAPREVRGLGFDGLIIAITAHSTHKLRESWYLAGCDAYLEKPVEMQVLIEALRQKRQLTLGSNH